jgi:hypothetical protein
MVGQIDADTPKEITTLKSIKMLVPVRTSFVNNKKQFQLEI